MAKPSPPLFERINNNITFFTILTVSTLSAATQILGDNHLSFLGPLYILGFSSVLFYYYLRIKRNLPHLNSLSKVCIVILTSEAIHILITATLKASISLKACAGNLEILIYLPIIALCMIIMTFINTFLFYKSKPSIALFLIAIMLLVITTFFAPRQVIMYAPATLIYLSFFCSIPTTDFSKGWKHISWHILANTLAIPLTLLCLFLVMGLGVSGTEYSYQYLTGNHLHLSCNK